MHSALHFGHSKHTPNQSRSSLPSRAGTPASLPPMPEESLGHRLKHMFDGTKTANFHVTVTINELGNVPQLAGDFAVEWKFRGKAPRGKDAVTGHAMRTKPSLPNLKLQTIHPSPSSSNLSVRTSSTSSGPPTPQYPSSIHSASVPSRAPTPTQTGKAASLPIIDKMTPLESSRTDNRPTDPTPLRESIGPVRFTAASPEIMSQYENEESSPDMLHPDRAKDMTSDHMNGAHVSSSSRHSLLPPPMIGGSQHSLSTSASSTQLGEFSRPPLRSGTGPSVSVILDSIPSPDKSEATRPRPPSRSASHGSSNDGSSNTSASPMQRQRSFSGPGPRGAGSSRANARKGTTQINALRSHTCTWDYEVQHTIKVPLGKPIPVSSGSATPRTKNTAPVVGAGMYSESGLRLIVQQYPSKSATNALPAVGDKDGMASVIHAVHHARHHNADNNPSERNSGNAEGEKTVFGTIDIDLAAFAGRGKTRRRFLLRGSRTNATIKLTVDMKWVGGEELWAAPPLQEGHHVTGMRDLIGGEAEERIKNDLQLANTPSNTSSTSSRRSSQSHSNDSLNCNTHHAGKSCVSLAAGNPPTAYKSYEHHLRAKPTTNPTQPPPADSSGATSTLDMVRKHTLRHRAHHTRHFKQQPGPNPPFTMNDLAADVVIEAIFNPRASTEDTPFTYVPIAHDELRGCQKPEVVLSNMFQDSDDENGSINEDGEKEDPGSGQKEMRAWGLRGMKAKRERRAATNPV